jgi:hypothetical protein
MTLRYAHLSPNYKRSTVELLCNRLETFWSPEGVKEKDETLTEVKNILYNKMLLKRAEVAELADARDLKSYKKPSTSPSFLDGKSLQFI